MNKQEEIRGYIEGSIRAVANSDSALKEHLLKASVETILTYLKSQGVAIKVEMEVDDKDHIGWGYKNAGYTAWEDLV